MERSSPTSLVKDAAPDSTPDLPLRIHQNARCSGIRWKWKTFQLSRAFLLYSGHLYLSSTRPEIDWKVESSKGTNSLRLYTPPWSPVKGCAGSQLERSKDWVSEL